MDRQTMYKILMLAAMCLAIISAVGALVMFATSAVQRDSSYIWVGLINVVGAIGFAFAADTCSNQTITKKLFSNDAEREILSVKQQRRLRSARAEVMMDKAMLDIENERQNIVHKQIEASHDPEKPPHKTQFSKVYPDVEPDQQRIERGY